MDNLQSPAYPEIQWEEVGLLGGIAAIAHFTKGGFTKLEKAALIIGSSLVLNKEKANWTDKAIAVRSVSLASAIIEQANK